MSTYAYNQHHGLRLEWNGYAEGDGRIIDTIRGVTTTVSGQYLRDRVGSGMKIGYGSNGFYDGHHIILYSVSPTDYNFDLYVPGGTYGSGEYVARGGVGKISNVEGIDRTFWHDFGDGIIAGFSNFYISESTVQEGEEGVITISRSKSKNSYNDLGFSAKFNVKSINDTALSGSHYNYVEETIEFASGEEFKQVKIKTIDNTISEGDKKLRLLFTLIGGNTDLQPYVIGDSGLQGGWLTIKDNDIQTPTYTLTPSAASINEGSTLTTSIATTNVA